MWKLSMIKRIYSLLVLLLFCSGFVQNAQAHLVLGADFYQTFVDTDRETERLVKDKYDNIAAVLGFDFNGVGVEGFYQTFNEAENDYGVSSKLNVYGADFVLRLPTSELVDFVGSAGYAHYTFETPNEDIDSEGLRVGFGLQFNFNRYVALRAMYHYTALTEEIENIKTINEFSAGIRIKF